ncbi:Predicted PurR-regulated permease PerM [Cognatiyoonia koreensis]|uniref:Predicted PurR-regulated permease PerM n=1 Tax=Cognatiyoonia koreensis TaxID=364200 RepID=A0A1I0QA50_9RHOB|nr:AI-2E family transporter [Cognatiyoonia koreensis]SEW23900.1 Predicted PurR-regulated permease PerM [Cognatiyoonia koreensis]
MGLSVQQQAKYWGVAIAVFVLALWFLGDVILPFVLGGAIAYCLDPIADRLEKLGCSRVLSVAIITLVAALFFLLLVLLVIPTLVRETTGLVQQIPTLIDKLQATLSERFPSLEDQSSTIRQQLDKLAGLVQERGGELVNTLFSGALGILNVLVLIVIVPVVAFYLLLDWDNMVAKIDELLPRDHVDTIRRLGREMDNTLASFIRGQGTVCVVLGVYYAIALTIAGLNFGLVIGFVAGLISFIPYVGALVGGVLAVGLALFQWWGGIPLDDGGTATNWVRIGIVAAVFMLGQFLEGNILTPKLVGNSVGLHPVWLLFALSVFGSLFGFVGMLVAVPVAALLGVLARFGLEQYRDSRLYQGQSGND